MKVLCVCKEGNSRSVALAYVLKKRGHEAIAIGTHSTTLETKKVLFGWADKVILTDVTLMDAASGLDALGEKLYVWDVGRDKYFRGFDEGLMNTFKAYLEGQPL